MRKLPNWITSWKDYREPVSESPILYNEWVAVSIIASVLQRKTYLPWDNNIYPNFYIILIGPAGKARKGSAMGPGNKIIREIPEVKLTAEATTREALIRHLKTANIDWIKADGTYEMFSSLTVYSEEFTTFIGYNNRQLMADLANWWDCPEDWTYDTKNKGTDAIKGVYFNLIGATTPDIFKKSIPDDIEGGGLLSRIIMVYEEERSKIVIFPTAGDEILRADLLEDLMEIATISGPYSKDKSFEDLYANWYPYQHKEVSFKDEHLQAYISRRSTHLRKLCMIHNAAREGNKIITAEDFNYSLDLLKRTEKKMAKTFTGMGASTQAEINHKILTFLAIRKEVLYKDLARQFINDIEEEKLPIVLAGLERMRYITIEKILDKDNIPCGTLIKWKDK